MEGIIRSLDSRDWKLDLLGMPKSLGTIMPPAVRVSGRVKWKVIFFHTCFSSLHHTPYHMKVIKSFATFEYKMVKHPMQHQSHSQKQHKRNLCFYCWFKKIPNGIAENKIFQNECFYLFFSQSDIMASPTNLFLVGLCWLVYLRDCYMYPRQP